MKARFVPDDRIPTGDETNRLHRWGYPSLPGDVQCPATPGPGAVCADHRQTENEGVRNALATNLSDLLRYQNMLCRYDTMALKSLDIFSVHGFPVGLIQCESNLLGIGDPQQENVHGKRRLGQYHREVSKGQTLL